MRPFRLGQIYQQKFQNEFEQYELEVKEIWDQRVLDKIRDGEQNLELLLSRFEEGNLVLLQEFMDVNDKMKTKMHATNVRFNFEEGNFIEYDSNQDQEKNMSDLNYVLERFVTTNRIYILTWQLVFTNKDSAKKFGNRTSYD